MVILCIAFWETAKLFSTAAAPFYIPTSNVWGFQFVHILASILLLLLFLNSSHSSTCGMVLYCGFNVHFTQCLMLSIFSFAYWPFMYFLWRDVYSSPLPILKIGFFFLLWSCSSLLIYSEYETLICRYFIDYLFTFLIMSFDVQKFLILVNSILLIFFFCYMYF